MLWLNSEVSQVTNSEIVTAEYPNIHSGEHTEDDSVYKCHVSPDGGKTFYTHSVALNVLGKYSQ